MKELLKHTNRISFEISNMCNYAHIHKRCPASMAGPPMTLSFKIIHHVTELLSGAHYDRKICFHAYNEPTIDPRLQRLIRMARIACPNSDIFIYTNGSMLDQTMLYELVEAGASSFRVSAYTDSEYERLTALRVSVPYHVERMDIKKRWIERINVYELPENGFKEPCHAPLTDMQIDHQGRIRLCCVDWQSRHVFGDLKKEDWRAIMSSGKLHEAYDKLRRGDRFLDLCKRCGTRRRINA